MTQHTEVSPDDLPAIEEQWRKELYGCHGYVRFSFRCSKCGSYTTVDKIYVHCANARKVRTLRTCESCQHCEVIE